MQSAYEKLDEFIDAANIKRTGARRGNFHHKLIDEKMRVLELNKNLVLEETGEFNEALEEYMDALCSENDLDTARQHLTKELCDAIYVLIHCAVELDIDLPRAFSRVHDNNMKKIQNSTVRDDGKLIKAKNHPAVDMSGF